ncbi:MAG: LysM peptidoglycan-binding domain-containing protein [Defluviitaleaceae bacterium]|nr:LysM peptidoglycan-binding domain-containing protein [Defluviitaleaceae bacterium]
MTLSGMNGAKYNLDLTPIESGGEGDIYDVRGMKYVAKIYKLGLLSTDIEEKLKIMIENPPNASVLSQVAWPLDLTYKDNGQCCGFIMPKLSINAELGEIYKYPATLPISSHQKLNIAQNICVVISEVHKAGYVFGDFNPRNIGLDKNTGLVSFLDTDTYHVFDPIKEKTYRCSVCAPGYAAPELLERCSDYIAEKPTASKNAYAQTPLPTFTQGTDNFALAIHIFRLLMNGYSPFGGIVEEASVSQSSPGVGDAAVRRNSYCFRPGYKPQSVAIPGLETLPEEIADLFTRAFIEGRIDPRKRPAAVEWHGALTRYEQQLVTCPNNTMHHYDKKNAECPLCEADEKFAEAVLGKSSTSQLKQGAYASPPIAAQTTQSPLHGYNQPQSPTPAHITNRKSPLDVVSLVALGALVALFVIFVVVVIYLALPYGLQGIVMGTANTNNPTIHVPSQDSNGAYIASADATKNENANEIYVFSHTDEVEHFYTQAYGSHDTIEFPAEHTIGAGESLARIATLYFGNFYDETIQHIMATNNITDPYNIRVGQVLFLTQMSDVIVPLVIELPTIYTVVAGDSMQRIARHFFGNDEIATMEHIATVNNMQNFDSLWAGQVLQITLMNDVPVSIYTPIPEPTPTPEPTPSPITPTPTPSLTPAPTVSTVNVREFADFIGGNVDFNIATQTVTIEGYSTTEWNFIVVSMTIGSPIAVMNGVSLEIATFSGYPYYAGQITLQNLNHAPQRFLTDAFGITYPISTAVRPSVSTSTPSSEPTLEPASAQTPTSPQIGYLGGYIIIRGMQYSTELTNLQLGANYHGLSDAEFSVLRYMTNLTRLEIFSAEIGDLSPIASLTNLTELAIASNQLRDITSLSGLTNLTWLSINSSQSLNLSPLANLGNLSHLSLGSQINDLWPLSNLTNLAYLIAHDNRISDLTPLSNLTNLTTLNLRNNQVSNLRPLSNLRNLVFLDIENNPIVDWSPVEHVQRVVR